MDFSPDYTSRIIYKYNSAGLTHTVQFRGRLGESAVVSKDRADGALTDIVTALGPVLPTDFAILSVQFIPESSNITFPSEMITVPIGDVATNTFTKQDKISHLTFQGKSTGGAKNNIKIYGVQFRPDVLPEEVEANFRFTPGEDANIDAAVAALAASGLPAIDGLTVVWHSFVNLKVNDFWLKTIRAASV